MRTDILGVLALLFAATQALAVPVPYNSTNGTDCMSASPTATGTLAKRQCGGMMIRCDGDWKCCFDSVSVLREHPHPRLVMLMQG